MKEPAREALAKVLGERLAALYPPDDAKACLKGLVTLIERYSPQIKSNNRDLWNEKDVVLITYGDQLQQEGKTHLATLRQFLVESRLSELLSTVHLLPFFPYSSDDGFSVIDYKVVDPKLGDWQDIESLGEQVELMFDFVLNHISSQSEWFQAYGRGEEPYTGYFIEADPKTDLSAVTRPRSLPLLTPVETPEGKKWVWTTFSADQIDLNYGRYPVLLAMIDVLLYYLTKGARIVRMDAIAYLWKEIGTNCIHLSQTHTVVKLFRDVITAVAPQSVLLTETNVPYAENISYFGEGDEAQMVYQFSLPPLLLDAVLNEDASVLTKWASTVCKTKPNTTYFNFTASHDGIGVCPLQGLIPPERLDRLVQAVRARGGHVNTKRNPDGTDSPYELNITYFDALSDLENEEQQIPRFLLTQAVMMALKGVPGIYFHSLLGSRNFTAGVKATGQNRTINRQKLNWGALQEDLSSSSSRAATVLERYKDLIQKRINEPALHPDADQEILDVSSMSLFAFRRKCGRTQENLVIIANFSGSNQSVDLRRWLTKDVVDILSGEKQSSKQVTLNAYQFLWLK